MRLIPILQGFYLVLGTLLFIYGAIVGLHGLQHGVLDSAINAFFFGTCGLSFGLLMIRLLERYQQKKRKHGQ